MSGKDFTVGVFPFDERQTRFNAYTVTYNPRWPGCCEHKIEAINGMQAKKLAIIEHKERCLKAKALTVPTD